MDISKDLRLRAYTGIVVYLLAIALMAVGFMMERGISFAGMMTLYIVFTLAFVATDIYYIWGFRMIAVRLKKDFLSNIVLILVIFGSTINLGNIWAVSQPSHAIMTAYSFSSVFILGGLGIAYGIGLLKLKDKLGKIATTAAVLNIVAGALTFSVVLIVLAYLLVIPMAIFEILLMLKAADTLKR